MVAATSQSLFADERFACKLAMSPSLNDEVASNASSGSTCELGRSASNTGSASFDSSFDAGEIGVHLAERSDSHSSTEDIPMASIGSALHGHRGAGICMPCAWFWKPKGCQNSKDCHFCHLCPEGEIKARKKTKVAQIQLEAADIASNDRLREEAQPDTLQELLTPKFIETDNIGAEAQVQPRDDLSTYGHFSFFSCPEAALLLPSAALNQQPASPQGLKTRGGALHGTGDCRPCAWFWKAQGCQNGVDCRFCHLCPEGELKSRKKAKVLAMQGDTPTALDGLGDAEAANVLAAAMAARPHSPPLMSPLMSPILPLSCVASPLMSPALAMSCVASPCVRAMSPTLCLPPPGLERPETPGLALTPVPMGFGFLDFYGAAGTASPMPSTPVMSLAELIPASPIGQATLANCSFQLPRALNLSSLL